MDLEDSLSAIGVSTAGWVMSVRFSTSEGLGESFLYLDGSCCGESGRLCKILLASSKKGQWGRWWSPSHNPHGILTFPFCPWTSFSLVDGVFSTWSPEIYDTGQCEWGDHSLKIRGRQGESRWKWFPPQITQGNLGDLVCGFSPDDSWLPPCLTDFFFFFSFPFFFFSTTWLLVSLFLPSEE